MIFGKFVKVLALIMNLLTLNFWAKNLFYNFTLEKVKSYFSDFVKGLAYEDFVFVSMCLLITRVMTLFFRLFILRKNHYFSYDIAKVGPTVTLCDTLNG